MKPSAKTALKTLVISCLSLWIPNGIQVVLAQAVPADLIFRNGRVAPDAETGRSWSQAISIRDGHIQTIGPDKAVDKDRGPDTKVIDLKGRTLLPGFNDAHVHFVDGGLALGRVSLTGTTTVAQIQERLKAYAAANLPTSAKREWLFGQGWDATALPGQKAPTRADLDAAVADRPVMLWDADGHSLLVNSKGLERLKIVKDTPSPKNGEIVKGADGNPTGLLLEAAATEASTKVDRPSLDEIRQAFLAAQDEAARVGVTSIQGGPIHGEEELKIVEELYATKLLKVRYAMWGELERPQEFLALKEKYKHLSEEWIEFAAVKGFIDGVLSTRTAALLAPYGDAPSMSGEPRYTQAQLNELVLVANRLGLPVALHAVGDRAVTMAVHAFAAAKLQLFNSRVRNRIEHCESVPPYIYQKFGTSNFIASVQPSHLIYDKESQNYNEARLGKQRVRQAFSWKSFFLSKAHVSFGSDWPVMPLNPLLGLFGAVYRQNIDGTPRTGWMPTQKISMEQAVDAYTMGSAFATHDEHLKGSLREGKFADLVVLDKDPFKARPKDLPNIAVATTVVAGRIVYDGTVPMLKAPPASR